MILVFDIGNTFCKVTLFDDLNSVIKFKKFKSKSNYQNNIVRIFKKNKVSFIVVGSVIKVYKQKIKYIAKNLKAKIKFLTWKDFEVAGLRTIAKMENVGLDILAFSYFIHIKKENAVGISYGTFTFSCLFSNSILAGVIISPSFSLLNYNSYFKNADLINNYKISFSTDSLDFGNDTNSAISSGILYYFLGYINLIWETNKIKFNLQKIYLLGGNLNFFEDDKLFSILKKITNAEIVFDNQIISKSYLFLFQWLQIKSKL